MGGWRDDVAVEDWVAVEGLYREGMLIALGASLSVTAAWLVRLRLGIWTIPFFPGKIREKQPGPIDS